MRRFLEEAKRQKAKAFVLNPMDCQLFLNQQKASIFHRSQPIPHLDVVLPRIGSSITERGLAILRQMEFEGIMTINSSESIAQSRNKLRSLQVLAAAKIPIPATALPQRSKHLRVILEKLEHFPVILKLQQGTQGIGVMLLNTETSLRSVMDTLTSIGQPILMQQFIGEGAGRDYRILVVGGQIVGSMERRARHGEFRSNIYQGGQGNTLKLPEAYGKLALQATQALGLEIAGVDLMESRLGAIVIEVNSSPGFEGLEKATGKNIAGSIISYMIKRKKNKAWPKA